jgi:general secretion pathway protein K
VSDDTLQGELLAATSLELTAYIFSSDEGKDAKDAKAARPSRGGFRFRGGSANVTVTYVSEAARIDLNVAPKEMLAGLFAAFGVKGEDAVGYASRIVGWRTGPSQNAPGTEEDGLYRSAGLSYTPRGGPFAHVDELWLVYGLPPALIERILPFVTVYSGMPKVNVRDAAPEVVAALPGMTPALLNTFLDTREAGGAIDEQSLQGMLGTSQTGATTDASDAYRVQIRIAFDNGRQLESEAVILTGAGDAPYHVLYWRDDAGNGPRQLRTGMGRR